MGFCVHGNGPSGTNKSCGISLLVKRQLVFKEATSFMKRVVLFQQQFADV
jgi:hypothetical protein